MKQYDLRVSGNIEGLTMNGLSGPELAGRWSTSEAVMRQRVSRGLATLRRQIRARG